MSTDPTTMAGTVAIGLAALLVGLRRPFIVLGALVLLLPFRDFSQRWLNAHTDLPWQVVKALPRWWFVVILVLSLLAAVHLPSRSGGDPRKAEQCRTNGSRNILFHPPRQAIGLSAFG